MWSSNPIRLVFLKERETPGILMYRKKDVRTQWESEHLKAKEREVSVPWFRLSAPRTWENKLLCPVCGFVMTVLGNKRIKHRWEGWVMGNLRLKRKLGISLRKVYLLLFTEILLRSAFLNWGHCHSPLPQDICQYLEALCFVHSALHVGDFPDQGLNSCPLKQKHGL